MACGGHPTDPAHIKSRGSGGGDELNNLVAACRPCHVLSHAIGWFDFCLKFPKMKEHLYLKGWTFKGKKLQKA